MNRKAARRSSRVSSSGRSAPPPAAASIGPAACPAIRSPSTPPSPRAASGNPATAASTGSPIFDDQPVSTIGSIAVAPSDPNVIYVGSGEANIRGNVEVGDGIYKSMDAGKTWKHVWKQEGQIGTIIVHPQNPDIAYAAVLGHAFGPNEERGVYRTTDGGKTWQQRALSRTRTPAPPTCASTRAARRCCSPGCGRRGGGRGS